MKQSALNLNSFRKGKGHVHFVGCGGAGTQPLMKLFHEKGFEVSGSDLLDNEAVRELKALGLPVAQGHRTENLPPADLPLLLIHSSAAGKENPELLEAQKRNALILRRGEALGLLADLFRKTVTVSGSHGKTSVSSMLAFALSELGAAPGCLIGGTVRNWPHNGEAGNGEFFVAEVDESDGTHACIRSHLGIVTNAEDDHAWTLGGVEVLMENFRNYAAQSERLLYVGSPTADRLFSTHPCATRIPPEDSCGESVSLTTTTMDLLFPQSVLRSWGRFQKQNALTALTALEMLGFPRPKAAEVLSRFPGVERRMTLRFDGKAFQVIEDYAHHPTELAASMEALRSTHPGQRLVMIFQPHRYARLERYFNDFARILQQADRVFITPVFAAWTAKGKFSSEDLAKATGENASALRGSWEDMARKVRAELHPGDLVAVIGAGDLKEILPFLCREEDLA